MKTTDRKAVIPLAMLGLMLAGCGDGGNLQGNPDTKAPSVDVTRQEAPSTPGGNRQTKNSAGAAISATGVRGDAVAQALVTSTRVEQDGKRLLARAVPWTERPPAGSANTAKSSPVFLIEQTDQTSNTPALSPEINAHIRITSWTARTNGPTGEDYDTLQFDIPVSRTGLLPAEPANIADDAESLRIGKTLRSTYRTNPEGQAGISHLEQSNRAEDTILRRNARFAWDEDISSWNQPTNGRPILFSIRARQGSAADQFRLCFQSKNFTETFLREVCSTWQVPTGWAPGQALAFKGHSVSMTTQVNTGPDAAGKPVIDTRETHWQTVESDMRVDPASIVDQQPWATPAISEKGVSGAFLAAILQSLSSNDPAAAQQPVAAGRVDMTGYDIIPPETPAWVSLHQTTGAGFGSSANGYWTFALRSGVWLGQGRNLMPTPEFPQLTLGMQLRQHQQDGKTVLILPDAIGVQRLDVDAAGTQSWKHQGPIRAKGTRQIAHDEIVPYHDYLQNWDESTNHDFEFNTADWKQVSLRLRNAGKNRASLCWRVRLGRNDMHRGICSTWEAPQGGTPGSPSPKLVSYLVYDADKNDYWEARPKGVIFSGY